MDKNGEGKELPLTRYAIEKASQQERMAYGALLGRLIERSGASQKALADAANLTARTIRNITQGKVAPQSDKIIGLLLALDIDVDDVEDGDVRTWTKMLAPVIRRIHPDRRSDAVSEAIGVLSDAALKYPFAPLPDNVTHFPARERVAPTQQDLPEVAWESDIDHSQDHDDYDA